MPRPIPELTLEELKRFSAKIAIPADDESCYVWTGGRTPNGYGNFAIKREVFYAHRIAYTLKHGPIPPGMTLDHLCKNRGCVNPGHLEPVTQGTNVLRGDSLPAHFAQATHCKWGHEFDEVNTYIYKGMRQCRPCKARRERDRLRRLRQADR